MFQAASKNVGGETFGPKENKIMILIDIEIMIIIDKRNIFSLFNVFREKFKIIYRHTLIISSPPTRIF